MDILQPHVFVPQPGYWNTLQVCPWSTYCVSIGQFGAIGESRSGILNVPGWAGLSLRLESMFFFWMYIVKLNTPYFGNGIHFFLKKKFGWLDLHCWIISFRILSNFGCWGCFFSKSIPGFEDFFWETFLWAWYQRVHICWNGIVLIVLVTGRNPLWQPHWKLLWSKVPPPQIDQIESGMPQLSKYIMHSTYTTSQHSFDPICFYVWNLWPSTSKSQVDWLQHLQRPVVRFGLFSAESPFRCAPSGDNWRRWLVQLG